MNFTLTTKPSQNYELLDSGFQEKLERFGELIVSRPDPQALWQKKLGESEWKKADAVFLQNGTKAHWKINKEISKKWKVEMSGLFFNLKLAPFKHVGIFPEQQPNWQFIDKQITSRIEQGQKVSVLNLFGYTGGASLISAKAGAEVCHVDGSKSAIEWAKENALISGLAGKPIRWILDDARKFVEKEIRRGKKYDALIMDPPSFGHGGKGELWKIEKDLLPFLESCKKLLSSEPIFVIINGYASGYSSLVYGENLSVMMSGRGGGVETGELTIEESKSGRLLPAGIFARWSAK